MPYYHQFRKITQSYYKGAQGIMLVCDVSDKVPPVPCPVPTLTDPTSCGVKTSPNPFPFPHGIAIMA
jgi:GTPase SAR1 family protein